MKLLKPFGLILLVITMFSGCVSLQELEKKNADLDKELTNTKKDLESLKKQLANGLCFLSISI